MNLVWRQSFILVLVLYFVDGAGEEGVNGILVLQRRKGDPEEVSAVGVEGAQ